jgi:hypothetical protein
VLLCIALAAAPAAGDDRAAEEAAATEKLCAAELPRWKLTADGTVLENPKEPVLRWTNPFAGRTYGNTYVWLQKGRPAAAGCMYRNFHPWNGFAGELVMLTGEKLVMTRGDAERWRPEGAWKWHPLPGSPAPAASAAQRLVQMKAIAAEFAVELLDKRNEQRGEDQTPRLLPKPLYRYDAAQTKALDGALFAFVIGTDPELLLLIECDTAAKTGWQFGVGRMNRDTIRLKRKGEVVWQAEGFREHVPADPYFFFNLPKGEPTP